MSEVKLPFRAGAKACQELMRMGSRPTHTGYLRQRSMLSKFFDVKWLRSVKNIIPWGQRYVVIKDGFLYIYDKEDAAKPSQVTPLHEYSNVLLAHDISKSEAPWCFKLTSKHSEEKNIFFTAASECEMKLWMAKIQEEICKANKTEDPEYPDADSARPIQNDTGPEYPETHASPTRPVHDASGHGYPEANPMRPCNDIDPADGYAYEETMVRGLMYPCDDKNGARNTYLTPQTFHEGAADEKNGAQNTYLTPQTFHEGAAGPFTEESAKMPPWKPSRPPRTKLNEQDQSFKSPSRKPTALPRKTKQREDGRLDKSLWHDENKFYDVVLFNSTDTELANSKIGQIGVEGVYLIRLSNDIGTGRLVLVAFAQGKVVMYKIKFDKRAKTYSIDVNHDPQFGCVQDLLDYYYDHDLPTAPVKLTMPFSKAI